MAKGNNVSATCLRLNGLLNLSNHGNRATLAIAVSDRACDFSGGI